MEEAMNRGASFHLLHHLITDAYYVDCQIEMGNDDDWRHNKFSYLAINRLLPSGGYEGTCFNKQWYHLDTDY
jgi:hypothetical protein